MKPNMDIFDSMRASIKWIWSLAATALLAGACSDVLNIDPTQSYRAEIAFKDETTLDHYIYGFYMYLKNNVEQFNPNATTYTDCYSDIMKSGSWDQSNHGYNRAILSESSFSSQNAGSFECWADAYTMIRRINEFLHDLPANRSRFDANYINVREAEARFVRAFAYYKLLRVYSRCVLRTELDGPEQNDKPLSTPEACWKFVNDELSWCAENLPETPVTTGRLYKAAAYGMLSRCALYAEQWQMAIDAADACKEHGADLMPNYADVFALSHCVENLISIDFTKDGVVSHRADLFFRPSGDSPYHKNLKLFSHMGPTSELVDEYEMADGTPFDWTTHGSDPYTGREPRFYASILYNGATWEGRTIETFRGGTDARQDYRNTGAAESTVTGYYLRKFITENETAWETMGSSHFGTHLRYAEVLLNKAEAYARLNKYTESMDALNEVRRRVGLPDRSASDEETAMGYIRHERMVELAGEGFRFWDLRRWKLGVEVLNDKAMHGVDIVRNDDGTFTYTQVEIDGGSKRIFHERYYAFAIPESERTNNNAIDLSDNNPGW